MLEMLGLAFGVGGALFALKFGDRTAKLIGAIGVATILLNLIPAVATAQFGQLAVAIVSAGFGLAAFRRTLTVRGGGG